MLFVPSARCNQVLDCALLFVIKIATIMSTQAKLIVFILAIATITVAQQPKTVEGYIQSGIALQRVGKHQEAIQDFAAALKLEPGNFVAQSASGVSYMYLERWDDAV